jgi:hypothetical protein
VLGLNVIVHEICLAAEAWLELPKYDINVHNNVLLLVKAETKKQIKPSMTILMIIKKRF